MSSKISGNLLSAGKNVIPSGNIHNVKKIATSLRQMFSRSFLVFVCTVFFLATVGCANKQQQAPAAPPAPEHYVHTVRYSGETLGVIALYYTGKTANWPLLQNANPGLKPERITLGQTIMIPSSLLIRQEALPEKFVRNFNSSRTKKVDSTETSTADSAVPTPEATSTEGAATTDAATTTDSTGDAAVTPETPDAATEQPASTATEVESTDSTAPDTQAAPAASTTPSESAAPAVETGTGTGTTEVPEADKSKDEQERDELLDELLSQ